MEQRSVREHIIFDKLNEIKSPIADGVIYLSRHGSKAYGTNIETSDDDYKGIGIPTQEYYYGVSKNFEQQEFNTPDTVIYELRKFFNLLSNCNPNCIEVLFTDPQDHIYVSKMGEKILENKRIFLSKRVRWSFAGYAISQLKRIKGHRRYLLDPPKAPPVRKDYGLEEHPVIEKGQLEATMAMIQKDMDRINFDWFQNASEAEKIGLRTTMTEMLAGLKITSDDRWLSSARKSGLDENFIHLLQREREYLGKKREWEQYVHWKKERNKERAKDEIEFGYDLKHAYHLIRLLRMCEEMLTTGQVIVKRPDWEELLRIRRGLWLYEQLIEYAETLDATLNDLYKTCNLLPYSPDIKKIDALCVEILEEHFRR